MPDAAAARSDVTSGVTASGGMGDAGVSRTNTDQLEPSIRVYYSGDELIRAAGMAGRVPEFDAAVEDFSAYSRRLQQYFVGNDITDAAKKRAVFLCAIGARTFGLLEDLIAPAAVEERSYEVLVSVLKQHFEPGTSAIVARFRFHTCVREEAELMSIFQGLLFVYLFMNSSRTVFVCLFI